MLIVYPCSVVVVAEVVVVHNVQASETTGAIKIKLECEASLGKENQSLYKWSRSHDQDGRHAHIIL